MPPRIVCPKDQAAGAFIVQFLPPWLKAAPGADIQSTRGSPEDGLSLPAPFPTQLQLRQARGALGTCYGSSPQNREETTTIPTFRIRNWRLRGMDLARIIQLESGKAKTGLLVWAVLSAFAIDFLEHSGWISKRNIF